MSRVPCRVIVDARGAALHALYTGKAAGEVVRDPETDRPINPPSHGLQQFMALHLLPLLEMYGTLPLLYVWDADDSKEIRKGMFDGYKKSREKRSETENRIHRETFDAIKQLLASLGILQVSSAGMEADDVIAFLAEKFTVPRVIYTKDGDLWQLHSEDCNVEYIGAKPPFLTDMVKPQHVALYKALVGDTSDDIPGVKGFGEKAWEKLAAEYGDEGLDDLKDMIATANLAELRQLAEELNDKALLKICEQFNEAVKCYQLARLHPEWVENKVNGKVRTLTWFKRVPSLERQQKVLKACGLMTFAKDLEPYMPFQALVDNTCLDDYIGEITDNLGEGPIVAFDYETYDSLKHQPFQQAASGKSDEPDEEDGGEGEGGGGSNSYVDVLSQKITGASFCFGKSLQYVIYIPTAHRDTANVDKSVLVGMFEEVRDVQKENPLSLVAHNAGFEWSVTKRDLDVELDVTVGALQDTAIWASYADENIGAGLKRNSKLHLNYLQTSYKEVMQGRSDMRDLSGEEVLQYGCDDSLCTAHLWHLFTTICELECTYDFVMDEEFVAAPEFYWAYQMGVRIDYEEMASQRALDASTMKVSRATIERLLTDHCQGYNEAAVDAYWDVVAEEQRKIFSFQKQKAVDGGKEVQHDWVDVKLSAMKDSLYELSRYVPPTRVKKDVEFKPTAAQMTRVCDLLGLPPVDKDSVKGLTEWLEQNPPEMDSSEGMSAPVICDGNTFKSMLGKALHQLKARAGDDYAAFAGFCAALLKDSAEEIVVGDELNFGSPQQMQALFYAKLALPVRLRAKVNFDSTRYVLKLPGSPATDKKALAMAFANDAPKGTWQRELLDALLKFRKALKREQSMWSSYPLWQHPTTGNIHPGIKNCGTVTRRPTSAAPNIFQVSKGDREPPHPRKTIRTLKDDFVIVDPDFNGQELRILASECRDPAMLDAYLGPVRKDLHTLVTTGLVHHVLPVRDGRIYHQMLEMGWLHKDHNPSYEEVNGWRKLSGENLNREAFEAKGLAGKFGLDYEGLTAIGDAISLVRDKAGKPTNFLIVYGGGYNTLSQNTAMPVELTKLIIDETLNHTYTRLKPWSEEMVEFARQRGFVQTAYGTRKHVSADINSNDRGKASRVERQLVNQLIQGCAADMLKVVLANVVRRDLRKKFGAYLMAPVYDELVYHVHRDAVVDFSLELMECMQVTPPGHEVPMVPELSLGFHNWHDLVGLGGTPTVEQIQRVLLEHTQQKEVA